jgi:hypothetical protein
MPAPRQACPGRGGPRGPLLGTLFSAAAGRVPGPLFSVIAVTLSLGGPALAHPLPTVPAAMTAPPTPPRTAAAASVAPCRVATIEAERGGFGLAEGLRLTITHDGRATLVRVGHARHGTEDRTTEGRIARRDFVRLAARAHGAGFFGMGERYDDPTLADGAWSRIAVQCLPGAGPTGHAVWWQEATGPAALLDFEQALWRWQERALPMR